jgi:hypothetical protein
VGNLFCLLVTSLHALPPRTQHFQVRYRNTADGFKTEDLEHLLTFGLFICAVPCVGRKPAGSSTPTRAKKKMGPW